MRPLNSRQIGHLESMVRSAFEYIHVKLHFLLIDFDEDGTISSSDIRQLVLRITGQLQVDNEDSSEDLEVGAKLNEEEIKRIVESVSL